MQNTKHLYLITSGYFSFNTWLIIALSTSGQRNLCRNFSYEHERYLNDHSVALDSIPREGCWIKIIHLFIASRHFMTEMDTDK